MNHIWTQISYCTPYQARLNKQMFAQVKKEENAVKLQEATFQISQKLLASQARTSALTKASQQLHNSPFKMNE